MGKRLKQAWNLYRHGRAAQGLLESLGLWKYAALAVAAMLSAALTLWSWVIGLPMPFLVLIALGTALLALALAGFCVVLYRVCSSPIIRADEQLTLGFFPADGRSIRLEDDVPREYRVKLLNQNGITPDASVVLERTSPRVQNVEGVTLKPQHGRKGIATVTLGPTQSAYFNLLEYNPMDIAEGKAVMHITHTVSTAPTSVPIEDYEFTLRAYSKDGQSAPLRVKFQRTTGPYSRMHQIDVRGEASDDDPRVRASHCVKRV
jgi:hypothetical protein